jgi:hypothetical protein
MNLPKKHNAQTKLLLKKVSKDKIAKWLLQEGYYPEQYVIPPCFRINKFELRDSPYFNIKTSGVQQIFEPEKCKLINISFPKTQLTERTFGIIEPKIYHDIVWHLLNEWDLVINTLFKTQNRIYSYSFPLPISKKHKGTFGNLRAGRMIYEFLDMAENDLVAESHNYKYILKTDIKNFYPSIYTHSIAWAIHTKETIRKKGNRNDFSRFLGLKIDKLLQCANDGCTNGIAVGPAISDLMSEIVLSTVDTQVSRIIDTKNIDFIGVRYKDDYRFLCQSKEDANYIIKTLQKQMASFNLNLNEGKSKISELPDGLFREWTAEFLPFSLRDLKRISYKRFENSLRGTLKVEKNFDGTGVVDRFLSELTTKNNKLKFDFKDKNLLKAISLLLLLKEKRYKSFPQILGIIEKIIKSDNEKKATAKIYYKIENLIIDKLNEIEDNQYDLIWLIYFVKSLDLCPITFPKKIKSPLINSLKNNRIEFFKPVPKEIKLFEPIKTSGKNKELLEYLTIFKKTE